MNGQDKSLQFHNVPCSKLKQLRSVPISALHICNYTFLYRVANEYSDKAEKNTEPLLL